MQNPAAWRAVACVALVLATACSGDDKRATPSATVPTAPAQTTTDPYAVPAVIDVPYVNRVLAGLDAAVGDVVRLVVSTRSIPPEVIERLKALYVDKNLLQLQIDSFQEDLRRGLSGYAERPGNQKTQVADLLVSGPSCIYARVLRDYTSVSGVPNSQLMEEWVALRPLDPSLNPYKYNLTGWAYLYEGFERDLRAPRSAPCSAG